MLHREYFPFMPTTISVPSGPIDPPTLEAEAPEGWWDASAYELFGAAENIAKLLHDASQCDAEILTPYVGFCAFSAAYMNLYVFRFPHMNLGRSLHAEKNLNYCMEYLERFRHVWKLGESWVSALHCICSYLMMTSDATNTDPDQNHQKRISTLSARCYRQITLPRKIQSRLRRPAPINP